MNVFVNFLPQVIFLFLLFLGMVMYANEVETKIKIKVTWDKKNNYNIIIIYEPFIANEIKARENNYTQSQVFFAKS